MKHDKMKRVLAATLSLLTVAGPMTANVGSVLKEVALVASAYDNQIATTTAWTTKTLTDGDFFETSVTLNKASANKNDTFKVTLSDGGEGGAFGDVTLKSGTDDGYDNNGTFTNVTSLRYVATNSNGTPAKKLEITSGKGVYTVSNGSATNAREIQAMNAKAVRVSLAPTYENNVYTVTLENSLVNTEEGFEYTIDDALRPYITQVTYKSQLQSGKTITWKGDNASEAFSFAAQPKTDITIVAKAKLGGDFADFQPTFNSSTGEFTYKFKAIEKRTAELDPANIKWNYADDVLPQDQFDLAAKDVVVIRPADKKEADWFDLASKNANTDDADHVAIGQNITVRSAYPFTIKNAKLVSIKTTNGVQEYQKADVTGVYNNGAFEATFVVAGDLNVELSEIPTDLKYTISGTKVTANATKDGVKIVNNAAVAELAVTKNVPVYQDSEKKYVKIDEKGNPVYTKTALASGKSISYDKDSNAFIELALNLDKNLLGTSGGTTSTVGGERYQIVLTKNGDNSKNKEITTINYDEEDGFVVKYQKGTAAVVTSDALADVAAVNGYLAGLGVDGTDYQIFSRFENFAVDKKISVGVQNAGKYNVQFVVWGINSTDGSMVCQSTFTVNPLTSISESDFTLLGFYKSDLENQNFAYTDADNNNVQCNAFEYYVYLKQQIREAEEQADKKAFEKELKKFLKDTALTVTKNSSGVYEVACEAKELKKAENATVTLFATLADGTACEVTGTKITGEQNKQKSAGLQVTNPNYNVKEISIKWMLVEKAVEDKIYFEYEAKDTVEKYTDANGHEADLNTPCIPATYDDLEEVIRKFLIGTNKVDVSGATFKYSEGEPVINEGFVDIDALKVGLPYEDNEDKTFNGTLYYIYANVGGLETEDPLPVVIDETKAIEVETILTKTTFVYGETITIDDIAFVEAGKEKVVEGLAIKADADEQVDQNDQLIDVFERDDAGDVELAEGKIAYRIQRYDAKGKLMTGDVNGVTQFAPNEIGLGNLVPGKYRVWVVADTSLLDKKGYEVVEKAENSSAQKYFDITVTKRTLDPTMFTFTNNDGEKVVIQKDIVNKVAKLTDAMFNGTDLNYDFQPDPFFGENGDTPKLRIVGGVSSTTSVGQNKVELGVVDDGDNKWTELYTGSAEVAWFSFDESKITPDQAALFANVGFEYDLEADNIYSDKNGVQIHAQVQLVDTSNGNAMLTNTQFSKLKISKYGFLYEKAGKLKDLKYAEDDNGALEYPDDYADAIAYLQLGICNTTNTHNSEKNAISGINSVVKTVEDYIWIRPYLVTEAGEVIYGAARRLDFQTVANQVIQPDLNEPKLVQKDDSIYYYAYASKVTRENAGYRTATPNAFGVVLSRNSNYAAFDQDVYDDVTEAYEENTGKVGFVDTSQYNKAQLAYYNELMKAYSITTTNKDAISTAVKNSTKYTEDECGTLVRITDSKSRVYVRTYVDFGNGLVVYSEPKDEDSASDILAEQFALTTIENDNGDAQNPNHEEVYRVVASRNAEPREEYAALTEWNTLKGYTQQFESITLEDDDIEVFGLIIDRNGNIIKTDPDAENQFLIGKGYKEYLTKAETNINNTDPYYDANCMRYGAATTWKADSIAARAYLQYKGIDIYGNIVVADGIDDTEQ